MPRWAGVAPPRLLRLLPGSWRAVGWLRGQPIGECGGAVVRVVRWLGARLLDVAALGAAGGWGLRRGLRAARGELRVGMAACDLDTGRFPEPEP